MRSLKAVEYLRGKGFNNVLNLAGGIHEWSTKIDPTIPTY
jgi:rhodanese-related sulfurtransferase